MMTAHNTKVDVDHLRRTLVELGYPEPVTPDAAPLIHRILTDLQQVTHQYSDLSQHYDDLVVRYQRETSTEKTSPNLDFTHLSGLDASLLGMSNIMDDSFMLRTVEEARAKIDTLQAEVQALQAEAGKLLSEKEAVFNELQQSQLTAQELSQLLHSRNGQVDALQSELETQKKKTDVGFMLQLGAVVKTAIYMLPNELHQAFAAKFSDSPEAQTGLLTEVLQRLQRDGDGKSAKLKEVLIQLEKCQVERSELEESLCKLKAGVSQYQTQIADLNARLSRKDFETTIQTDLTSQISSLEAVNTAIREKLTVLDRLKLEGLSGAAPNGEVAQMTVKTILESLSAELNTEVCFTSHLNQLVDKLNKRRSEQDQQITQLSTNLRDTEARVLKLEGEKTELLSKLERTLSELSRKDGASSTTNEVIHNLQQAVESKQSKIEEQKRYCNELKTALEQCQLSMGNMRRNEEMIRKHVVSQDEEIRAHRLKYEALNGEKARWQSRVAELEAEMVMIKNAFKDKADEGNKSANDLKSLMLAKEKAELDLKSAKDHVRELEETLLAKRKEKDLLMTTYCRVIKDNEKLHSDLQKLHEDFLATKAGDLQSETAMKAFQTKIQVQSQELDRFKSQLGQAEGRINELESRLQDSQRSSKRLEDEVRDKEREIRSLKGIIESLEKSKRDIAGQLARFGQQANELRGHLRRMEDEKSDLQSKLKSSTMDSPANRNLQNQIVALTMDLDQSKSQLRTLEREKETLSHQAKLEKLKATQMEEMMKGERSKRLEKESIIADLERTRSKLKGHFDILNEEHNKGVLSMKKQIQATRDENERLKRSERRMNFDFDRRFGGGRHTTPSPPDSPVEGDMILPKTEKLRAQNQMLKKNLRDIQKEIKQNMSPGKFIDPELETSIVALTSEEADESSSPTSDEIVSSNAEIRKRLEKENALLVKIVEKVKNDLMKAGLDTPMSISSNI